MFARTFDEVDSFSHQAFNFTINNKKKSRTNKQRGNYRIRQRKTLGCAICFITRAMKRVVN